MNQRNGRSNTVGLSGDCINSHTSPNGGTNGHAKRGRSEKSENSHNGTVLVSRGTRINVGPRCFELHAGVWGDFRGLRGNFSGVYGNVTGCRGDVSQVTGDMTYITGDVTAVKDCVTDIEGDVTGKTDFRGRLPRKHRSRVFPHMFSLSPKDG